MVVVDMGVMDTVVEAGMVEGTEVRAVVKVVSSQ